MHNKEIGTYCPKSQTDWRHWLKKNHKSKQSVWLIYHTKKSNVPSLSWSDAVDEALCFGWIDSTRKKINDISFMQFFSKRKPKSNWSKINKEKVQQLIDSKRMTKQGYESVETAKQNGYWTILDEIEEVIFKPTFNDHITSYSPYFSQEPFSSKIFK